MIELGARRHEGYDYRARRSSVWFALIFYLHPQAQPMADVPLTFKLHRRASALLRGWRPSHPGLVHVVSAPVGYVARPR